ncbi:MAG: lipase maturation factor family protein [Candidatus Acidiferrales bacterium]
MAQKSQAGTLLRPDLSSSAIPVETSINPVAQPGHLGPRWIFLRALGLIYFSAFFSLVFQIKGLMGPNGILPAGDYLEAVSGAIHPQRFWFAPTLLWLDSSNHALMLLCFTGMIASLLVVLNLWPRGMLVICFVCFISFVAAAQDFSGYQSDGMLLEAGFISIFFAPPGFRPGLGRAHAPSRISRFLLLWEWFRIYFESGVAKVRSGDLAWRQLTAMDDYYQNGPLPTWLGWYVQQFPHWFHASTAFLTLAIELVLVWALFLPRRFRIVLFCIVTPFEMSIILTANYTFLNYLVLSLGFLLLDDRVVEWILPQRCKALIDRESAQAQSHAGTAGISRNRWRKQLWPLRAAIAGICLGMIFYVTTAELAWMVFRQGLGLPEAPVRWLEPFRIANRYGLFAVMTHARYEIEFQGTRDGKTWVAYPFRYKPQDEKRAPGIYAPYQPRLDWNLWFASLGSWRESRFVIWTEERLLKSDQDVLALFAGNPFAGEPPPVRVRAVIYQYWFTDAKTRREQGTWWRRELLGEFAPALEREPNGKIVMLDQAPTRPPPP